MSLSKSRIRGISRARRARTNERLLGTRMAFSDEKMRFSRFTNEQGSRVDMVPDYLKSIIPDLQKKSSLNRIKMRSFLLLSEL